MSLTDQQIQSIVVDTRRRLHRTETVGAQWLCDTMDEAVNAAAAAQRALMGHTLAERAAMIDAMRRAARENVRQLSELAHRETGYGSVEHKVLKNLLAIDKTPGVEDLHPDAVSGDFGLTLMEKAPFGVIGAITPSTNPTSTVINNSISMISAGNAVVFNPHPAAKRASTEAMRILNDAIRAVGGPAALICTVKEPTLETGKALMEHKQVPLLAITGGEAVVRVAMKTGKKVIAAGPGNPPVIVDDTANIKKAAKDIVDGASFDNNVLCIAEKEVFVYAGVADALMAAMQANGAYLAGIADTEKIVNTVFTQKDGKYTLNRKFVGKPATYILRESGVHFAGDPRIVIAEVTECHPFITMEMLMPVLGIVRVKHDIRAAIEKAVAAEDGCKHTAIMHSQNVSHLSMAAKALNTTIFVKNAPSYAGLGFNGEGFASLTIATPTGEGITSARTFTRSRRCVLYGDFRIV